MNRKPHPKRRWLKWIGIGLGLLVGIPAAFLGFYVSLNRTNGRLVSGGERRAYLLYIPPGYDPATPAPLVISIHGFAEWPAHQMQVSGWNELADEYGFLVVYPSGAGLPWRWRAGGPGTSPDVVFISDLIDRLAGQYNIDLSRVYANGLSNGGGMSYLLACKLSERIAAIGSVAGAYLLPLEQCNPARTVPMIVFHGTDDPIVPFTGGPSEAFDHNFPVIPEWVAGWADRNACREPPLDLPVQGDVSGIHYAHCADGAACMFYTIHGGGHSWPGGGSLPQFIVGSTNHDIRATRLMWKFFQQYTLPLE